MHCKGDMTNAFMRLALVQARQAAAAEEVPIGAVIVKNGHVIAGAYNVTEIKNDPTAHAEMVVIRQACELLESARLNDCDMYVTLEPCPMCATAISFARIRRLYYGASDVKGGGVEHGPRIFSHPTCHHRPEVYGGIAENECAELLKVFFAAKRGYSA